MKNGAVLPLPAVNYRALEEQMDLGKIYFGVGLCVDQGGPAEGQQKKSGRKSRTFSIYSFSDVMCLTSEFDANVAR